jgi:hypothetical protein
MGPFKQQHQLRCKILAHDGVFEANVAPLAALFSCFLHCTALQDEQCSTDVLEPWRFSVMSYNILADKYVSSVC